MAATRLSLDSLTKSNALLAVASGAYLTAFHGFNNLTLLTGVSLFGLTAMFILPLLITTLILERICLRFSNARTVKFLAVFCCMLFLFTALHTPISGLKWASGLHTTLFLVIYGGLSLTLATGIGLVFKRDSRMLALFLALMSLWNIISSSAALKEWAQGGQAPHSAGGGLSSSLPKLSFTPNIYLILADGYGSFDYMEEHDIDVQEFKTDLASNGFRIYPSTFSNYQTTTASMAALLGGEHHYYKIRKKHGEITRAARISIAGANNLVTTLKGSGYDVGYIHESYYLFYQGCYVDRCHPDVTLSGAIRIFDSALPGLGVKWRYKRAYASSTGFNEEFDRLLENVPISNKPHFAYLHITEPGHAPNAKQGKCDEQEELDNYRGRVTRNSTYLHDKVDRILQVDPGAVIVLAGDHGPYITHKCARGIELSSVSEYRDRAGVLLAVRWPKGYDGRYDDQISTTINVFRYILASLTVDDSEMMQHLAAEDTYIFMNKAVRKIVKDGNVQTPALVFDR